MARTCIAIIGLVGAIQIAGHCSKVSAQDLDDSDDSDESNQSHGPAATRRIKEHVFLFPTLQDSAFVTTHVGIREGFALFDVPDVPIGMLTTRDVTLSGVQQSFDLAAAFTDWLGVFGFGRAVVVTGVDQTSLIVDGASVAFVGNLGAVVRLLKNERSGTQVALRVRVGQQTGREVTLQPLLRAAIGAASETVADAAEGSLGRLVLIPTSETDLGASAHVAQYIARAFSLQGAVTFERGWETRKPFVTLLGRRSDQEADVLRLQFAAAAELDFSSLFAPISILGEFMYQFGERTVPDRPDSDLGASTLGLGLYYVGRPNLQVGVSGITTLSAEPRRGLGGDPDTEELSGDPMLTYVDLILRYIW